MNSQNTLKIEAFIFSSNTDPDNEVYVSKTVSNILKLIEYGITKDEITGLDVEDGMINIYPAMHQHGFAFAPRIGFFELPISQGSGFSPEGSL